ncbi:MAG TPA: ABC transporter ATP-binding protein [Anaerolineaceae bacterium]|nr:ABC transporter ATP-binding protein [Anaerolineaceae bacterium]
MSYAIETDGLSKSYGAVEAVEGLSLRVAEGEIYAFLGLNGAGKTTTIRLLLGMIRPSAGSARVLGTKVRMGSTEPWARVGYLVETPHAYPELTVFENLEAARRLHPGTPPAAIGQIIERLALDEYADRRAGTLSQGNAQRLGLAKALLHHPRLLILDEPANGLDPAGIVEIRALLRELTGEQGVTVFMSSHILAEVSRLAGRIGIIHAGRLIKELDIEELERDRRRRLLLGARDLAAARAALVAAGCPAEVTSDGAIELRDPAAISRPDDVAVALVRAGTPPTRLVVEEEDLEQYFLRLVGMNGAGQ